MFISIKTLSDTFIAVALSVLIILQACGSSDEPVTNTLPNCTGVYPNVLETDKHQDVVQAAIDSANLILNENIPFRLRPAWEDDQVTSFEDYDPISVHIIELERPGKYSVSFVPQGYKCIFVDASLVTEAIFVFSGRKRNTDGGFEPDPEIMLTYLLLHEAGHVYFDYYGDKEALLQEGKKSCESDFFISQMQDPAPQKNIVCTDKKIIELIADKFAAQEIKHAWESPDETDLARYDAGLIQMILNVAAIQIIFQRAEDGTSVNPTQDNFLDVGYSHPNTELRILVTLTEINPDMKWMLDDFLAGRQGRLEERPEIDFSHKDSTDLIVILNDKTENLDARTEAAKILGERKDTAAVEVLINSLDEQSNFTGRLASTFSIFREEVVRALGEVGDLRAIDPLLKVINIEDINVQMASAEALAKLGDPKAVPILISKIHPNNNNRMLQISAIEALGEIQDERAVEPLIFVLLNDSELAVSEAANSLGKIRDPRAVEPLTKVLETDVNEETKQSISQALRNIEDSQKTN